MCVELDILLDLGDSERAWGRVALIWEVGCRDDVVVALSLQHIGDGNAAGGPELYEDVRAIGVDGVHDLFEAGDLLLGPDAGRVRIAAGTRRNDRSLIDDEAARNTRALLVIFAVEVADNVLGISTEAGQRSHDHAVLEFDIADADGGEESRSGHVYEKRCRG
ncbi:hypothetical protein BC834DRAFT_873238 [Gloeopeniophorella convolvens]|nr:hypothetical protein BC834DRAFT_873238 [Gloeopeniophorella convolvens]